MCYYMGFKTSKDQMIRAKQIEKEFGVDEALKWVRSIVSGFEYGNWPVLKPKDGVEDFDITMMHWELIPFWVKDMNAVKESRKKFTTLNATCENLLTSKMFRDAALKRRCIAVATHFFEWRHITPEGRKTAVKYPYHINVKNQEYFYMAAIYSPWTDKETGETMDTFALVTTTANPLMKQIHNTKQRQPTILTEDLAYEWMFGDLNEERIKEIAAYQFPAGKMHGYTVAKDVRNAYDPVEAVEYPELEPLQLC